MVGFKSVTQVAIFYGFCLFWFSFSVFFYIGYFFITPLNLSYQFKHQLPIATQQIIPKLNGLKPHTFIISQFLWVRNIDTAELNPLLHGLSQCFKVSAKRLFLSEVSTGERYTFKFTPSLLATLSFLLALGLWPPSVSCYLGLQNSESL